MDLDIVGKAFAYPEREIVRRHGPDGYTDYTSYKPWLRDEFWFRCVYCLERERWTPDPAGSFSVDHFQSKSKYGSLINDYDNLFYSCVRCNRAKLTNTGVLNPCETIYGRHLLIDRSGHIIGLTLDGNIHINILQLNDEDRVRRRGGFIALMDYLMQHGDAQARSFIEYLMGYPNDLPDLGSLRPPTNFRPDGTKESAYYLRESGNLMRIY